MNNRAQMGPTPKFPVVGGVTFLIGALAGADVYEGLATPPVSQDVFGAAFGVGAVLLLACVWVAVRGGAR